MLMKIIEFAHEITNVGNENVNVFVQHENGYTYIIVVGTLGDLLKEID